MSDSQQYEKVSVSSDGVTVDKRFEEDEFPVPAIAFEIQSERTVTVSITLVDQVPEDVAVEDLGFHPEYGSEYWTIDEDEITFEREIEANSEYTTVYGIRATGTDNVEQFLTEPTIERVDPPLEDDAGSVVEGDGSDVVRDVISGDSDSVPGLEDEEDDDVETLDLKDPNAPDDEDTGSTATADTGTDSGSTESTDSASLAESGVDASTLCGALATEIRNGNVDEDDVKLLRKAFDLAGDDSGSTEARIKRLQTEVADLLAYTDSLEEFLDENGTGNELIEGFREDLEAFESDVEEIRELAESHEGALEDIEATVDSVESSVESVENDMDSVLADVKSVENDVEDVSEEVDDVSEDVEDVSEDVEDVSEDVEELEEQVGDIDVSSIEGEIEDIEEEIEELKEWREQLSSVIGGE